MKRSQFTVAEMLECCLLYQVFLIHIRVLRATSKLVLGIKTKKHGKLCKKTLKVRLPVPICPA